MLSDAGQISKQQADEKALAEYQRLDEQRRLLREQQGEQDIDALLRWTPPSGNPDQH